MARPHPFGHLTSPSRATFASATVGAAQISFARPATRRQARPGTYLRDDEQPRPLSIMFLASATPPLPRRMMALAFPTGRRLPRRSNPSASEPDRSNRLAWDRRKRRSRAALWAACRAPTWSIHAADYAANRLYIGAPFVDLLVDAHFAENAVREWAFEPTHSAVFSGADQAHRPRFADQERAGIKPRGTVAVGIHQAGTRQRSGSLAHLDLFLLKQVVQIVVQVVIQVFRPVVGARAYRRYP